MDRTIGPIFGPFFGTSLILNLFFPDTYTRVVKYSSFPTGVGEGCILSTVIRLEVSAGCLVFYVRV